MKFGAFVITFNRPETLQKTLQTLLGQARPPDVILVADNGSAGETEAVTRDFPSAKVIYQAMGDNRGPAGAAAYGLNWLIERGCEWVYWGDDDDPPKFPDTLERLLTLAISNGQDNIGGVGAVGNVWDWQKGEAVRLPDEALRGVLNVDAIAGGSQLILRSQAVQKVGLPDADLFFGFEEPSYCLRLRKAGYRLLVDAELMWRYREQAGRLNLNKTRSALPRHAYHSIWRQYYSTRNYIFVMKKTFGRPDLARREACKAFGRALASWGRGVKYGSSFTGLQLRGVVDGYFGWMGRTVTPRPQYKGNL